MSRHTLAVEERRQRVAILWARKYTETEIGRELGYDQTTISKDLKVLRERSQAWLNDLGKSSLPYLYKSILDSIKETEVDLWRMLRNPEKELDVKDKLTTYKLIVEAAEKRFNMLNAGPMVLVFRSMNERLEKVEEHKNKNEITQVSR
jgi:DNA-binding transcriptional ArsR family regulator